MWDAQTGWKWEAFADYFDTSVLQTIASFEVFHENEKGDNYFWDPTPTGHFSVKTTIKIIRGKTNEAR